MKCIKNSKTGNIVRVSNIQAYQMVGNTWEYTSKSEWKAQVRVEKTNEQTVQEEKKEKTISEKAIKHSKLKEKQRPADLNIYLLKK